MAAAKKMQSEFQQQSQPITYNRPQGMKQAVPDLLQANNTQRTRRMSPMMSPQARSNLYGQV
jgi:hypothetical protein